jgi:hypothetical protein
MSDIAQRLAQAIRDAGLGCFESKLPAHALLYYWLKRNELAARCFDKHWMTLQCS